MGGSVTLSDELVEKASRLMGQNKKQVVEQQTVTNSQENLKSVVKEMLKEVLAENGLIVESVEKSNDNFRFQVGKHVFEGKLTKIKKLS
jgi:hypothetical protein